MAAKKERKNTSVPPRLPAKPPRVSATTKGGQRLSPEISPSAAGTSHGQRESAPRSFHGETRQPVWGAVGAAGFSGALRGKVRMP